MTTTDLYAVFDSLPDSSGALPPFASSDGTIVQAVQPLYQTAPAGNQPVTSGGAVSLNPSTPGTATRQGWYGQIPANKRVTKLGIEFQWTENKPALWTNPANGQVNQNGLNGPVTAFYASPMAIGSNGVLAVPSTFAVHGGPSRSNWHIDVPSFLGPWPVFSGTFNPVLAINTRYNWVIEYTGPNAVKITLPDGTVQQNCQHTNFGQAGSVGNYGFYEIWLGNAINESNLKISAVVVGFDQYYPNTATPTVVRPATSPPPPPPPPPHTPTLWYEARCRNEDATQLVALEPDAVSLASTHVAATGHVVEINPLVR